MGHYPKRRKKNEQCEQEMERTTNNLVYRCEGQDIWKVNTGSNGKRDGSRLWNDRYGTGHVHLHKCDT
ncbi:hypothetical protein CDAR_456731 [Caerostris darwini]|uniref:Uncharacterized protein n=1 Tax=Caerostris darwini TaxID=1538125 RepID=A0AAV4TK03_9ARAC|nr:hypothetical protein CDAR_456731 [Caerostris darwini]